MWPLEFGTLADLAVVLIRPHCPQPLVVARGKGAVGLGWVAVDERPEEHRVRGAAHLMLDGEEVLAAREIDDVAKAILIGIVFAEDEIAIGQARGAAPKNS